MSGRKDLFALGYAGGLCRRPIVFYNPLLKKFTRACVFF